ncbi:hypothetical protein QVD17_09945 [Tagetes erecta]|uniref:SAP domain-containing protein n=1 Tax=Tagetes erecta TaxID=13708 RepID=A0AAD8P5H8_TARER|nr:hypothetical protein QVD17_09945 [Tagetes erecta]
MNPSVVLISSDEDEQSSEEEEELESEDDTDYSQSDDDEDNDVEISDEEQEECFEINGVHFNQGSNELPDLSLKECKEYLRKHQLRLSGTKEECIQRIKEHGRLKDGRGESLYPRSSFSINCTGDACKGDVVLFRQKVYKKRGHIVGKRTVAGRIVKESYGTSKQQHTFTVEVLWSKPNKNLPPLSPLLVKGRNLYRLGTYRQPWKNEAERSKVLGEKHTRGDAARHKRKLRQAETFSNNDKGRKRQKVSNRGPSQSKQQTKIDKHKSAKRRDAADLRAQKAKSKTSIRPTFQGASSSSSSFPYDRTSLPPFGFSGYGLYNNGQPRVDHVLSQPHGHYHYNYEHHVPRHRFG